MVVWVEIFGLVDAWVGGWMDGWMDQWVDWRMSEIGRMDGIGWLDGRVSRWMAEVLH